MAADLIEVYENHIRPLSEVEQLRLAESIIDRIARRHESLQTPRRSIMELHGKGASIWSGLDAKDYVARLRGEWDHRP
jgi:hypothetical protein